MYLKKYYKIVLDKTFSFFRLYTCEKKGKSGKKKKKKDRALREYFLKYGIIIFTVKYADSCYKAIFNN